MEQVGIFRGFFSSVITPRNAPPANFVSRRHSRHSPDVPGGRLNALVCRDAEQLLRRAPAGSRSEPLATSVTSTLALTTTSLRCPPLPPRTHKHLLACPEALFFVFFFYAEKNSGQLFFFFSLTQTLTARAGDEGREGNKLKDGRRLGLRWRSRRGIDFPENGGSTCGALINQCAAVFCPCLNPRPSHISREQIERGTDTGPAIKPKGN